MENPPGKALITSTVTPVSDVNACPATSTAEGRSATGAVAFCACPSGSCLNAVDDHPFAGNIAIELVNALAHFDHQIRDLRPQTRLANA